MRWPRDWSSDVCSSDLGGAQPGTERESYEGEPRMMQIEEGFWMGRTEVTVGQFRRFVEETSYLTDAEKTRSEERRVGKGWRGSASPTEREEQKSRRAEK